MYGFRRSIAKAEVILRQCGRRRFGVHEIVELGFLDALANLLVVNNMPLDLGQDSLSINVLADFDFAQGKVR